MERAQVDDCQNLVPEMAAVALDVAPAAAVVAVVVEMAGDDDDGNGHP